MDKKDLNPLLSNFQISPLPAEMSLDDSLAWLKSTLAAVILRYFEKSPEKLFQILYRIDVSEQDIQSSMDSPNIELNAQRLAEKVITRELKKIKTRRAYKN